ncbi:diaminopropionate ammonia-lyase [Clostridium brassicae]|uniref:Diaminopropionate ammonia-lyase n=1 Tax=Clostridium brassicae TaxID=2999072 RepID=A0ABT4DAT0_9CLOT|nr:diaminopropionate ammonia-lyase [Clostridium brassicae]MCY6959288.1 diaminopropionate ammonia-lyase [Clostridium brassicae]
MKENIKWIKNEKARQDIEKASADCLSIEELQKVRKFHESFNVYSKTPLAKLDNLAKYLGVSGVFVKDESYRFGLNAFKVLGGSYAIGKFIAKELNTDISEMNFEKLRSEETRKKIGQITFTTATDGNHGRGVAWAAQQLGQKAVVYMPKGSSETRLNNIKATGAEAYITDMNYDDAVRLSLENANKYGWKIIQDTAWEGYQDVPLWIMQGYATMMIEAAEQMKEMGVERPTHVFVQAGVGSLAGAVQGFLASYYKENRPITAVVEPNEADCMYRSAVNGKITNVGGDMPTIMAGLACGEPNPIGWGILDSYSDMFVSCPDNIAAQGMRVLGNPLQGDDKVISGESGAVPAGFLYTILTDERYKDIKEALKIDENSKILLISTEGDTDPENYRKIVWDGDHPYK